MPLSTLEKDRLAEIVFVVAGREDVGPRTAGTPGRGSTSRMETVGRRHGPVATRRVIGMRAGPVGSGLLLSISGLR